MKNVPTEAIMLKVEDGTDMRAYVARPSEKPKRGIVIFQEAFGVNEYIRRMTERFVGQGYLAIAPELFHRSAEPGFEGSYTDYPAIQPHMQAITDAGLTADSEACMDWLASQGIPGNNIAVLGFCMGGRAAFLANAAFPVAASVSFYGGGIAQTLTSRAGELHAPQLIIWGGKDAHILAEHRRAVSDALTAAQKPFVETTFSDADHAFARDVGEHYDEHATREAWALVDAFLANNLV